MVFRYPGGEDVRVGDLIRRDDGTLAVVRLTIAADSADAETWHCEGGGVLIQERPGTSEERGCLIAFPAALWDDEEFELVERETGNGAHQR